MGMANTALRHTGEFSVHSGPIMSRPVVGLMSRRYKQPQFHCALSLDVMLCAFPTDGNQKSVLSMLCAFPTLPHQELMNVIPDLLPLLNDSSNDAAKATAALSILQKLPHAEIMELSGELLPLLDDVAKATSRIFSALPPRELVKLVPELRSNQKSTTINLFCKLPHAELLMVVPNMMLLLVKRKSKDVREATAKVVSCLPPADLVQLVPQLQSMLRSGTSQTIPDVLSILQKLPHAEIMELSGDLLPLLDDGSEHVANCKGSWYSE